MSYWSGDLINLFFSTLHCLLYNWNQGRKGHISPLAFDAPRPPVHPPGCWHCRVQEGQHSQIHCLARDTALPKRRGRQTHLSQFILQPSVILSRGNCTNMSHTRAHALLWSTALCYDILEICSSQCVILLWVCSFTLCLLITVACNCLQGHTVHLGYYLLGLSPLAWQHSTI